MADHEVEMNQTQEVEVKSNGDVSHQEETTIQAEVNAVSEEGEETEVQEDDSPSNTEEASEENQEENEAEEQEEEQAQAAAEADVAASSPKSAAAEKSFADPSLPISVTGIDQRVRLRMGEGKRAYKPQTIIRWLKTISQKHQNAVALGVHRKDTWIKWTYEEFYRDIRNTAKSLIHVSITSKFNYKSSSFCRFKTLSSFSTLCSLFL